LKICHLATLGQAVETAQNLDQASIALPTSMKREQQFLRKNYYKFCNFSNFYEKMTRNVASSAYFLRKND
jgi:hypothetical protein